MSSLFSKGRGPIRMNGSGKISFTNERGILMAFPRAGINLWTRGGRVPVAAIVAGAGGRDHERSQRP